MKISRTHTSACLGINSKDLNSQNDDLSNMRIALCPLYQTIFICLRLDLTMWSFECAVFLPIRVLRSRSELHSVSLPWLIFVQSHRKGIFAFLEEVINQIESRSRALQNWAQNVWNKTKPEQNVGISSEAKVMVTLDLSSRHETGLSSGSDGSKV